MQARHRVAALAAALVVSGSSLRAQQPADSVVQRQQRTLDSLTSAMRALQARVDSLRASGASVVPGVAASADTAPVDELAALRAAAGAFADSAAAAAPPPSSDAPRRGANALNPEISVTGDTRANWRDPGPQTETFLPREFEVAFQSALDPFSTAKVFLSAEDGQVSLEEGYLYFTALPAHVRLDVGQFRQAVGELNRWHLHALPEDEYPLVVRRYAGEEGLVAPGISAYWPLPFSGAHGAYELTVQATSGTNEVLFLGGDRPAVNAQLSGFWQLSRASYAQLTLSGVHGTNPDTSLTTDLGVASARFSWRPPDRALSRDLTLRAELWALRRDFDVSSPAAFDATRLGGFVDGTWRLNRSWIAGVRGDYVQSPDPGPLAHEWAVTPSLTYWTSEFVYLRALYERSRTVTTDFTNRLTLQVVFAMGPHKHELF